MTQEQIIEIIYNHRHKKLSQKRIEKLARKIIELQDSEVCGNCRYVYKSEKLEYPVLRCLLPNITRILNNFSCNRYAPKGHET